MGRVQKNQEITVKLGNALGSGAALFSKLKEASINVAASCCYQIGTEAQFSIVPEDLEGARRVLTDGGFSPVVQDVLLVELPNEPGALASLLQEISALGVQVTSAYVTTTSTSALAVVKTGDNDKVADKLT
jgi:hypothetical protein